jgi:hypothetical protein
MILMKNNASPAPLVIFHHGGAWDGALLLETCSHVRAEHEREMVARVWFRGEGCGWVTCGADQGLKFRAVIFFQTSGF